MVDLDTDGAHVTCFTHKDTDVLVPRPPRAGNKIRSGMFIADPFGPDSPAATSKHGPLRHQPWEVAELRHYAVEAGEPYADKAVLTTTDRGVHVRASYRVEEMRSGSAVLSARLALTNTLDKPVRRTPGYHPYLMVSPDYPQPILNILGIDQGRLDEPQIIDLSTRKRGVELQTPEGFINVVSYDGSLPQYCFWSDGVSLCVEPTSHGAANSKPGRPSKNQYIEPGETRRFMMSIFHSIRE